jgi:hypothetical protein
MKNARTIFVMAGLSILAFTSCKKDYSCTCTTTVGSVSTTKAYDLENQTHRDADDACERYERDANNGGIGTTNCHL